MWKIHSQCVSSVITQKGQNKTSQIRKMKQARIIADKEGREADFVDGCQRMTMTTSDHRETSLGNKTFLSE